jgi:hypothetical protein
VGGRFDANNGLTVTNASTAANSMRGAGIQPIMMRSFVNFMLAEAYLYLAITGETSSSARTEFENGIRNSFQDVRDWAVNGTYGSNGFGASPTQTATINAFTGYDATAYANSVNTYVTAALTLNPAAFPLGYDPVLTANGVDGVMNVVAREYWVALFGNGIEAYNLYRRTGGMPSGMQPAISATPGAFPRTFWYPVVFEARNGNVEQKSDLTGKVFWDMATNNLDY